jgi:hypothetical protein
MKKQKVVTEIEAGVNRRFFQAMDALEALGSLRSLSGFCDEVGLSAPRFREMRLEYGVAPAPGRVSRYSSLNVEALHYLVKDFGVSGDWLLAGKGKMFR